MPAVKKIQPFIDLSEIWNEHLEKCIVRNNAAPMEGEDFMIGTLKSCIADLEATIKRADTPSRKRKKSPEKNLFEKGENIE